MSSAVNIQDAQVDGDSMEELVQSIELIKEGEISFAEDEQEEEATPDSTPVTPLRDRTSTQENVLEEESSPSTVEENGEVKSLPTSGTVTPVPERETEKESTPETCPSWSIVLQSPTEGEKYSPSRELNRQGSLHGTGLLLAVERAKKLSKCGRRCANLLYDLAALYDTLAQSILKSCQALQSPMGGTPAAGLSNACIKSLTSFAKQMQGFAICLRGSVARPLHGSMASLGETAPNVYTRYTSTRTKCFGARKTALQMRSKYVKAVREAESAIHELKQARQAQDDEKKEPTTTVETAPSSDGADVSVSSAGGEASSDANPFGALHPKEWERSLKKLGQKQGVSGSADVVIRLLNEVQTFETQYCNLVEEENKAVSQSETVEQMALEALQELEEERLHFFVETIKRTVEAEKGALNKIILSSDENQGDDIDAVAKEEKKGNVFTSFLKTASSQFDEGIGIMESETLGLPEEVGTLRDDVKTRLAHRASRCQATKNLVNFFEEIALACSTFGDGLTSRLGQEGYGPRRRTSAPNGLLFVALEKNEGRRVLGFWNSLITTVDDSAVAARCLSEAFKATRKTMADSLSAADREMRIASDADDHRWKYLCDAARVETRAQSRYKQTSDQFEKARDRARSVDDGTAGDEHLSNPTTPVRKGSLPSIPGRNSGMTQGMTKALGNVMSILPNGGEHAMKMMTPNARRQLAQTTLEEANEKETKDKNALDAAISVRSRATKSYEDKAKVMIGKFKDADEAAWAGIRSSLESSVSFFEDFRQSRHGSLKAPSEFVGETANAAVVKDIVAWTERARKHVEKKDKQDLTTEGRSGSFIKKMNSGDSSEGLDLGFSLQVQRETSKDVYKLLDLVDIDGQEPDPLGESREQVENSSSDESRQDMTTPNRRTLRKSQSEPLSPSTRELISLSEALRDRVDADKSEEIAIKPPLTKAPDASKVSATNKAETEVFLAHFWSDRDSGESPPTVIESFSCAYWPKEGEGYISPLLHGRMFTTSTSMYFVGWGGKKIVLKWKEVTAVTKETTLGGTIGNAIRIAYSDDSGDSSYFFGSFAFRDNAYELVDRLSTIAKSLNEMVPGEEGKEKAKPVPPDSVLKKMEVLLSKKMKNVSIQNFYEVVWSEGNKTNCQPFYGPWLEYMGSRCVKVSDWEFTGQGSNSFLNQWDGERYRQRREVSFEFTRKTHLYIGPPVAQVKQTHYCRVDRNDKVVLAMTVEMVGIPYADCFCVEVRWVARRDGSRDLLIEVGVFVDFKKSTMFANKIRAGTVEESRPVHTSLFEAAKKACVTSTGEPEEPEPEATDEVTVPAEKKPFDVSLGSIIGQLSSLLANLQHMNTTTVLVVGVFLLLILRFVASFVFVRSGDSSAAMEEIGLLRKQMDDLHNEMRSMQQTLDAILSLMKESAKR